MNGLISGALDGLGRAGQTIGLKQMESDLEEAKLSRLAELQGGIARRNTAESQAQAAGIAKEHAQFQYDLADKPRQEVLAEAQKGTMINRPDPTAPGWNRSLDEQDMPRTPEKVVDTSPRAMGLIAATRGYGALAKHFNDVANNDLPDSQKARDAAADAVTLKGAAPGESQSTTDAHQAITGFNKAKTRETDRAPTREDNQIQLKEMAANRAALDSRVRSADNELKIATAEKNQLIVGHTKAMADISLSKEEKDRARAEHTIELGKIEARRTELSAEAKAARMELGALVRGSGRSVGATEQPPAARGVSGLRDLYGVPGQGSVTPAPTPSRTAAPASPPSTARPEVVASTSLPAAQKSAGVIERARGLIGGVSRIGEKLFPGDDAQATNAEWPNPTNMPRSAPLTDWLARKEAERGAGR